MINWRTLTSRSRIRPAWVLSGSLLTVSPDIETFSARFVRELCRGGTLRNLPCRVIRRSTALNTFLDRRHILPLACVRTRGNRGHLPSAKAVNFDAQAAGNALHDLHLPLTSIVLALARIRTPGACGRLGTCDAVALPPVTLRAALAAEAFVPRCDAAAN